jgi:hypothetical protein
MVFLKNSETDVFLQNIITVLLNEILDLCFWMYEDGIDSCSIYACIN